MPSVGSDAWNFTKYDVAAGQTWCAGQLATRPTSNHVLSLASELSLNEDAGQLTTHDDTTRREIDTTSRECAVANYSPVARGWKKGHNPPGGRTKRDLFYLKGMDVYFMKRMVVQKLSRYNNSD